MSKAYIKGGTPVGSESLCRTCANAHIMTGYRESEMVTICTDVHPNIVLPFAIYDAPATTTRTARLEADAGPGDRRYCRRRSSPSASRSALASSRLESRDDAVNVDLDEATTTLNPFAGGEDNGYFIR